MFFIIPESLINRIAITGLLLIKQELIHEQFISGLENITAGYWIGSGGYSSEFSDWSGVCIHIRMIVGSK
jgi:hypothetical protein